jgi:hypothetical protein
MIPVASEIQYNMLCKFITVRQNENQILVIFHLNTENELETTESLLFMDHAIYYSVAK